MDDLPTFADWAQIISIPVAIIAILIGIWQYIRNKQKRALACIFSDIISPFEIKSGEAIKGDLEIRYQGRPIQNIFIVRATLKNIGNMAVRKADIVEPITFTFDSDAELLRPPQKVEAKPENLSMRFKAVAIGATYNSKVVRADFDLFNPGEQFTVEFICTGESAVPKVTARIEGISHIQQSDSQNSNKFFTEMLGIVIITLTLMTIFIVGGYFISPLIPAFFFAVMKPLWGSIFILLLLLTILRYFAFRLDQVDKRKNR
jgi:hypothetical protein